MSDLDATPEDTQSLGFSTVIASTVHDMKNSLGMLMQAHSALAAKLSPELNTSREQAIIEYESMRLNGMLVQMLGLYKLGVNQLPLQPSKQHTVDVLLLVHGRPGSLVGYRL